MNRIYRLSEVGKLAAPADNVAVATRVLTAGLQIEVHGKTFSINYTVLEGHRFAITPIAVGQPVLSWGMPFGFACRTISPGGYVCNQRILEALHDRRVQFDLPPEANFEDRVEPYQLDERRFQPGVRSPRKENSRFFQGYFRSPARGVGSRNYIVILATTSRTASYARALQAESQGLAKTHPDVDGIVAVTHTEGGGTTQPNNLDLLLRTLAGFMIHPNVGAVLAVDYGDEPVTNRLLRRHMQKHAYPLSDVAHHFLTLEGHFQRDLKQGTALLTGWLQDLPPARRTRQSLDHLKVALQCGGSDAFSGISANPLLAWVAKEILRYGGAVNLAETDELMGAEAYMMKNVQDLATARRFLSLLEQFRQLAAWHGQTAEGNPSGGNHFRGLYNITLKSLGAAMKRHPDTCLDHVIKYGERMVDSGFYFMDSPGNDLESVAGQVASGANLIFFSTGNGSVTNFPFVPTLKVVTTTTRYQLLSRDMDVNAGTYLEGTPIPVLGRHMLGLTLKIASGKHSVGEQAGHSQVSIWRNWPQTGAASLKQLTQHPKPSGRGLAFRAGGPRSRRTFLAIRSDDGFVTDQIGLVLPTSLCSSQIARLIADRLNARWNSRLDWPLSRFVALPHTEGCGVSSGPTEELYTRTLLGYLTHPLVRFGLLIEHGCEKTHNGYMTLQLERMGLDPTCFGWASIQLDGGIDQVSQKVEQWFFYKLSAAPPAVYVQRGLETIRLGLLAQEPLPGEVALSLAKLTRAVVSAGGTVVIPDGAAVLTSSVYLDEVLGKRAFHTSLAYGQKSPGPGLYTMEAPTDHWVENLSGLGATGVELMLAYVSGYPMQAHPMIPLLQVSIRKNKSPQQDLDLILDNGPSLWWTSLLGLTLEVASRTYQPKSSAMQNTDFQVTRGLLGVSL